MDRTSDEEVGGPYATQADAERAMRGMDKSSVELEIIEQPEADEPESDSSSGSDQTSRKESSRREAFTPGETPQTQSDQGPAGPSDPGVPELPQPMPQESVAPPAYPQSTKPSQTPSGGPEPMPGMDPGMMGMPVGMPAMPSSPQFDPGSLSTDPVGTRVNAVATLIGRQNPGLDEPTVRRVARKVVGRLITGAWGWEPLHEHIEDPHAHGNAIPRLIRPPAPRRKPGTQVPSEYSVFRRKDPEALGVPHGPHQQGPVRQPSPQADPDPWDEALHRPARPDTWDEPKRPLPGEREEGAAPVIPDLSEFDQPAGVAEVRRKFRDLREELGLPHGEEGLGSTGSRSSLPFTLGDWGWKPEEEAPEDPKAENAQDDGSGGQDKGDKGGSSLPGMPKMPKIPGMGGEAGGEAGAAAGGGEAAGGAAAVEELAPLLLV